jgi:hypothetical protein
MHKVELLEQAFEAIKGLGYQIREECVGGNGGGSCVLRGQKWFFVDPVLGIEDQLDLACEALRNDGDVRTEELPPELRRYVFSLLKASEPASRAAQSRRAA